MTAIDPRRETRVLDNGLTGSGARGADGAARLGVVLVSRGLEGRATGSDRRVALVRAHELQGHHQYPTRPGQGDHRSVRRLLERLHLDRPDDIYGDGIDRRARQDAVHRVRTDESVSLRPWPTAIRSGP